MAAGRASRRRSWLKVVGVVAVVVVAYDVIKGRTGIGGVSNLGAPAGSTTGRTW